MKKKQVMPILRKIQSILKEYTKETKTLRVSSESYEEKRIKAKYILNLVDYLKAFRLYYALSFKDSNELIENKDLIIFEFYFHNEYENDNIYGKAIEFIRQDIQRLIMQNENWKIWVPTMIYNICLSMYMELLASDIVYEAPMNNVYRMNRLRNFNTIVKQNLEAYKYTKFEESYIIMYNFISKHEAIVNEFEELEKISKSNEKLFNKIHINRLGLSKEVRITARIVVNNYKKSKSKQKADEDEEIIYRYFKGLIYVYVTVVNNSVLYEGNTNYVTLIKTTVLEEVIGNNKNFIKDEDLIIPVFIPGLDSKDNYIVLRPNKTKQNNISRTNPFTYYTCETISEND